MSNPKISVIVPVYEIEDYLEETLLSLLNQSIIDDLEVIMVDDGSTDESRYIIERYALDYPNFHAYHKQNEGQGIARNFGLEVSSAEYVTFLDSDDYLPPYAYERLYDMILKNGTDFVIGNVVRFARYNEWDDILFKNAYRRMNNDIDLFNAWDYPEIIWDTAMGNKIYRKDFLKGNSIAFPQKKIYFEDLLFSFKTFILADSISYIHDISYYWRLTHDRTSVTQQEDSIKNFKDRLNILRMIQDLIEEYDVDEIISNEEYLKWINHDLKFFLKRFDEYPSEYHEQLFEEVSKIVDFIPDELIENLNSYKKVLFRMIQNRDFESFKRFAPLENELYENPEIPEFLGDEYVEYFDFHEAMKDEELLFTITDSHVNESGILLDIEEKLNYLSHDEEYELKAKLVDGDDEYALDVAGMQITVPFSLIKNKNHLKIKIKLIFDEFEKTAYLKTAHRRSIELDAIFVDLNMGAHSRLFIDVKDKKDNEIEIYDITFKDDMFILKGKSKNKVDWIYIENIMDFAEITYPVEYKNDELRFEIPYKDIFSKPIKKWEINCRQSPNAIAGADRFEFYTKDHRTKFVNSRNKIFIENDIVNCIDELTKLNDANKDLNKKVYSLIEQKNEFYEEILEFKSRKVVRFADRIKHNK